jgi:crotonobetainyl-CoA:carnitine CoA-transferase CaiB-like acyl-CoA transferase
LLDELAPLYAKQGIVRERQGADIANTVPHSHYESADGRWFALACSSERMFQRLTEAMGRPEMAHDDRYNSNAKRIEHRAEVNACVAEWMKSLSSSDLIGILERHEVPCAPVYSIKDIFEDPQYAARNNLQRLSDARVGELVLPTAMPLLSDTPAELRHAGGAVGQDNEAVYRELLGITADKVAALQKSGVI